MSDADSPNDQTAPAVPDPSEQPPAVAPTDEDGWQTVDFPGAMSIDALPQSQASPSTASVTFGKAIEPGVIHYSSAELDPATAHLTIVPFETPDTATQLQHLQDENAALRDRLAQAELDLAQHQIEWQLEAACAQAESTTDDATHDRLQPLLQALERSQQAAQRQQILVETLTEQLESSQERIAQLERDCALTQQRHNEQVQQVLQAESTCRDLRLRLHRQQQQTLQFKAALEKCLEMPTVYQQQVFPEATLDDSKTEPHPLAALLKPKNQPVKPWSQPAELAQASSDQPALPKPLSQLLNHIDFEQSPADLWHESDALMMDSLYAGENQGHTDQGRPIVGSTDAAALLDSDDPQFVAHLMQLMFPETAEGQTYPGTEALEVDVSQAESIFDLKPFVGAAPSTEPLSLVEQTQPALAAPQPSEAEIAPAVIPDATPVDRLWQDLDSFIDPPVLGSSTEAAPATKEAMIDNSVPSTPVTPERGGIPPFSAMPHAALTPASDVASASDRSIRPLNAWTWRDRLSSPQQTPLVVNVEQAGPEGSGTNEMGTENEADSEPTNTGIVAIERVAQHPSKLLSLSTLNRRAEVKQTISVSNPTKLAPASFVATAPSPIVYPLRSSKKLASLAAVDLPTFPKR